MSPDDIFAAQFWPWPDPAIKRDAQGRVIFVNAAFLQLYGGTVPDWTGNVVGGWPAPQGPGQPYRFETRMPPVGDMGEQVYDWFEASMADGNAFAIARNVTMFLTVEQPLPGATQPEPPQMEQIPPQTNQHVAAQAQQNTQDLQPVFESTAQTHIDPAAAPAIETAAVNPAASEPAASEPAVAELVSETTQMPVQAVQVSAPDLSVPESTAPDFSEPVFNETPQIETPQIETPQVEASSIPMDMPETAGPSGDTMDRAYERRALPIESESAVLGNNWRDAVIAKAVGAVEAPAETEDVTAASPAADEVEEGPKRILLAEDNAINALLTRTLLEAEGHTVETVQDGQLAVEAMKTSTYDLIFMDMRMPNMDGLEATRKIRTMPNVSRDLPIIALTANAFDDDRNACFDSGMNDFMTKPVSAEELSEMVAQYTRPKEERMAS